MLDLPANGADLDRLLGVSPRALAKNRGITTEQARACQHVLVLAVVIAWRRDKGVATERLEEQITGIQRRLPRGLRDMIRAETGV